MGSLFFTWGRDHSIKMSCRGVLIALVLTVAAVQLSESASCVDNNNACSHWAQKGYCSHSQYKWYMSRNCRKSCRYCTSVPATPAPPVPGGDGKCGVTPVSQTRVVNGFNAKEGAWPWIASLQRGYNGHFCGGTLIAPNWVLTASHCVSSIRSVGGYRVVMGAHNRGNSESSQQARNMKRVIMHPQYNSRTLFADHALIEVDRPFQLNSRVVLGCLPRSQIPVGSQSCYIAGWGMTRYPGGGQSNQLMQARMPVVGSRLCRYNNEVVCVGFGKVTDPNACRGDSGGPLMCRNSDSSWTVHGVASFVVEYCKYYTGYSPVSKYLSWIAKYVPNYKQH